MKFVGCVEGREISWTRKGANPHTAVLLRKKAPADNGTHTPETEMTEAEIAALVAGEVTKALKASAGMSDVVKGYVAKMPDDKVHEFMKMAPAEQEAMAKKAFDDAEAAKIAEAAKAAGISTRELELTKSLEASQAAIADLKKRLDEKDATADIEKRARTDFAGYPGGEAKVVELLKGMASLPEETRKSLEEGMKTTIKVAKMSGTFVGLDSDLDMSRDAPVAAEVRKRAQAIADKDGVSVEKAAADLINSDADLRARAFDEELRNSGQTALN